MYFIQQRRRDVQNWLANSRWQWVLWVERIYRGVTPFIVETYFSSRQIFGQDGKATDTAIVAAEMLTPVRPKGYETNKKYFVHVFSDANNRGVAARSLNTSRQRV
jgi:hypothetical protein